MSKYDPNYWKAFLKQLNHPDVRNMYWLLASPSPLAVGIDAELPIFPTSWQEKLVKQSISFFKNLDQNPNPLELYLLQVKSTRLGVYAESLLGYFLTHFSDVKLILKNYQVIVEGITLGEIDFVFEWEGRVIHLELAVKYYLAESNKDDYDCWIGPNARDNLANKLMKAKHTQLPLLNSSAFQQSVGLSATSFLFMKGVFFTKQSFEPGWKNPKADFGNYLYVDELEQSGFEKDLTVLERPNWMADLIVVSAKTKGIKIEEVIELVAKYGAILLHDNTTKMNYFVIEKNWPNEPR